MKKLLGSTNRTSIAALIVLTLSCVGLLAFFAFKERETTLESHFKAAEEQARHVESHITQSLQAVELLASSVESKLSSAKHDGTLTTPLKDAIRPFFFIRSISVLDASGKVLSSSNPRNVAQQAPLKAFYPKLETDDNVLRIGPVSVGRDLYDSHTLKGGEWLEEGDVYFFPLLKRLHMGDTPLYLFVAINPDYFATQFMQMLPIQEGQVQWIRYDGLLLCCAQGEHRLTAKQVDKVLLTRLQEREFGHLFYPVPDHLSTVTAYRASNRFPLVVLVSHDQNVILATWRNDVSRLYAAVIPVLLGLAGAAILLWRQQLRIGARHQEALEALVTERTHDLVQARQDAESANQAKSDFLALMSHELRTPIAGVIGMLNMVLRDTLPFKLRDRIQIGRQNAEAMLDILNDLLDISKIEAGKMTIESVDFDLRHDLSDALALMDTRAKQKDIDFQAKIDDDVPLYLKGDPTRLRQILMNLLGNAIKFTTEGQVDLYIRRTSQIEQTTIEFEIQDTGIGMSAEVLGRLFQKFQQADLSTTRRFGGTGLGLAITKQMVELMQGTLTVTSTEGVGSCFHVRLPLPEGQAPVVAESDSIQPHDHMLRILVSEDNPTNQLIIQTLLEDMGHLVTMVEHGLAALQTLSSMPFDVWITDGRMPVMDGIAAIQHFRQGEYAEQQLTFPNPQLPIIVLTATASNMGRQAFVEAGANWVLSKPLNEKALHQTLEQLIKQQLHAGHTLSKMPRHTADPSEALLNLDALLDLGDDDDEEDSSEHMASRADDNHATSDTPPQSHSVESELQSSLHQRMMTVFFERTPLQVQQAATALAIGDTGSFATIVHGIKGSASHLWATSPVIDLAAQLEHLADAGQSEAVQLLWPQLLQTLADCGVVIMPIQPTIDVKHANLNC